MKNRSNLILKTLVVSISIMLLALGAVTKNRKHFSRISDMTNWINKYPFDEIADTSIFSLKELKDETARALGQKKFNEFLLIEQKGPQTPVQQVKDFLYFTVCEVHNCGHMFYFLVNFKQPRVFICERDFDIETTKNDSPIKVSATWYSSKGRVRKHFQQCEVYDEKTEETDWGKTISSIPAELL